jgi:uncharacterized protein (DUF1501 family)
MMTHWANKMDDSSRREFLSYSALACLGVAVGPSKINVLVNNPTAKKVIYLFMNGGMSHLDTFDPKPESKAEAGPLKAIKTAADGVRVSEYFPLLAKQMDKICLIRSMNSTTGAHGPGQYIMRTSYAQRATIRHPGMGAWLMAHGGGRSNSTLPGNVVINGGSQHPGSGFMESKFAPLPIGKPASGLENSKLARGVNEMRFKKRRELAEKFNKAYTKEQNKKEVRAYGSLYEDAVKLMKSADLAAFDITKEPQSIRDLYGESDFGQGCLLARRLVEKDVRFVEVNLGGWDTHNDNFDRLTDLGRDLDQGLSALILDLSRRGLLEETMVVLATEFGRSPTINETKGRNHFPKAFSCLMAGGGVKGGQAYGETDAKGNQVLKNKVTIQDFNATIAYAVGIPGDKVVFSPSKRPFKVAHKGQPIKDIF